MTRLVALAAWVALVAVAFGASPPPRPDQGAWLVRLLSFDLAGIDPWVVAHFNAMGLWPPLLAVLLRDRLFSPWRLGAAPAWPFVAGSVVLGAFALLPWAVLGHAPSPTPPPRLLRWLAHPAVPALIGLVALVTFAWAAATGDLAAWLTSVRTEQFMWAMTFDFGALCGISIAAAALVRAERPAPSPAWCVLPLVGAAIWATLDAVQARRATA